MLLLFVAGFVVLVSGFAGVFGVTGLVGFGFRSYWIYTDLVGIWKVPVLSSTIIVVFGSSKIISINIGIFCC